MTGGLQVAIIDYGMGNLFSVARACEYVGLRPVVTADSALIMASEAAILPGVGAFGDAMDNLKRLDLIAPLKELIASGKPFAGVCLGMQLLMSESEEFGNHKGLDIIEGSVIRLPARDNGKTVKVPQIGWNQIFRPSSAREDCWANTPLTNIENGEFMYFVHSYYPIPVNKKVVLTTTDYGKTTYCSTILWQNIFATQYHPEKSGRQGLKLYRDWVATIKGQVIESYGE